MGQPRQNVLWVRGSRDVRAKSLEPKDGAGRREMSSRRVGVPLWEEAAKLGHMVPSAHNIF